MLMDTFPPSMRGRNLMKGRGGIEEGGSETEVLVNISSSFGTVIRNWEGGGWLCE